jgi:hypothetical protein
LAYADVKDMAGNLRASENISFTAEPDTTAPTVTTFSPEDGNISTAIDANLTIVFNETVQRGTRNIVIKYDANGSVFETIDITGARVAISSNTVTIDPTDNFDFNTKYYVTIDGGVITDSASALNEYAGMSTKGNWDFTTVANPNACSINLLNIEKQKLEDELEEEVKEIKELMDASTPSSNNLKFEGIIVDTCRVGGINIIKCRYKATDGEEKSFEYYQGLDAFKAYITPQIPDANEAVRIFNEYKEQYEEAKESFAFDSKLEALESEYLPKLSLTSINPYTTREDVSDFNISIVANKKNTNLSYSVDINDSSILSASFPDGGETNTSYEEGMPLFISLVANKYGTVELNITAKTECNSIVSEIFIITVSSVNDSPVITIDSTLSTNEDNQSSLTFSLTDVEDADTNLTLSIEANATHGNVTISGNNVTYTPTENYFGADSFTVSTTDSNGSKVIKVINVMIPRVNDAPTLNPIANIIKNTNFSDFNISLTGISDVEIDDLNISFDTNDSTIITLSKNWTNPMTTWTYDTAAPINLTISSEANQSGVTEVTVTVNDGRLTTSRKFNITVVDTVADNFNLTNKIDQPRSTAIESNSITVTGIDTMIDISITDGEYRINGGNWTDTDGIVGNNDKVTVRLTSSSDYSTTVTTNLSIGNIMKTFSVTTEDLSDIVVPIDENGERKETTANFDESMDVDIDETEDTTTAIIKIILPQKSRQFKKKSNSHENSSLYTTISTEF